MDLNSINVPGFDGNQSSSENLVIQLLKFENCEKASFSSLQSNSSMSLALDFYNDIKNYKNSVKEINRVQCAIKNDQEKFLKTNKEIDFASVEKYSLLRPASLISEKSKYSNDEFKQALQTCNPEIKIDKSISEVSLQAYSKCKKITRSQTNLSYVKHSRPSVLKKSKGSIVKLDLLKEILVAHPQKVEFHNCDVQKIYKKTIKVQNVDNQLARFKIEGRPLKSPFTIFVESPWGTEKDNIAPGMHLRIIVQYKCVDTTEPEEMLILRVRNGRSVTIELKARRDPPILKALAQSILSPPCTIDYSEVSTITESESIRSRSSNLVMSNYSMSPVRCSNPMKCRTIFDCKRCFVGEYVIVSTVVKNVGGKARFFVMSEVDWCLMKIEDVTQNNILIVPPFAIWPTYFILGQDEQLTLYTYFFPDSYGLQADEWHIVTDNCSVSTIDVFGDGVILEPQSLQFDKNIKYQWFKSKSTDFCTIRYVDLGNGVRNGILASTFTINNNCELDFEYHWEISDILLCIAELRNTVRRKNFDLKKFVIEPTKGVFAAKSTATFKIMTSLFDVEPGVYRLTLQLIVEDIPFAALSKNHNFYYESCDSSRRLCEDPVNVYFENVEVRLKCVEFLTEEDHKLSRPEDIIDETLLTMSFADLTIVTDSDFYRSDLFMPVSVESTERSDDVCRFIQGYGACDCCKTELISTAVLRPDRPLHVGVESIYTAVLSNKSTKRVRYYWSNVLGSDHTKMKIKIEPNYDHINPISSQIIKFKILPLESGIISSIFISCQFAGRNPLVLSIECVVEGMKVSLYFPTSVDKNRLVRIEWTAKGHVSKYDKKTEKIKLTKKKLQDEEFIHTLVLNSSDSLIKSSNFESNEDEEVDISTDDNLTELSSFAKSHPKFNTLNSLDESWFDESEYDESEHLKVLPYFDFNADFINKYFRYVPLVIEFHVTPEKGERKCIYLVNESSIVSKYYISTKNDSVETNTIESSVEELESGVTMTIEPTRGEIKPYEIIEILIIANSNTWGIYTDEVTVNIEFLPKFTFWVRIINDKLPISYPICKNSPWKIPKLRFKIYKPGCWVEKRKLWIENTSVIPLYVHWHCFLINDDDEDEKYEEEKKPFLLLFDMLTPFIGIDEYLAANSDFMQAVLKFFSCAFNPYKSKGDLGEISEFVKNRTNESSDSSARAKNLAVHINEGEFPQNKSSSKSAKTLESAEASCCGNTTKEKDTEFQINIVPYSGKLIYDVFIIEPQELYLPPKEKRYIEINVNTENIHEHSEKLLCKAHGFIRIPPIFKYKDNVFFRKDGYYLPPTEVHLECDFQKPYLSVVSNRSQRTFVFHTKEFIQKNSDKISCSKKLIFRNVDNETYNVVFDVSKPFEVSRVSTQREIFYCGKTWSVRPGHSVQVIVKCTLNENDIESLKESATKKTCRGDSLTEFSNSNTVTLKKCFMIKYKQGFTQTVAVYIKLCFPFLKVSSHHLYFDKVCVGKTKSLIFKIENLLDRPHHYKIEKKNLVDVFTIFPQKCFLTSQGTSETSIIETTVNFTPMEPGIFRETLNVISKIEGLVAKCSLEGCAV